MGMLIKGELVDNWLEKEIDGGEFKRMESSFRNCVTVDGSAGPTGDGGFRLRQTVIIYMYRRPAHGRIAPSYSEN